MIKILLFGAVIGGIATIAAEALAIWLLFIKKGRGMKIWIARDDTAAGITSIFSDKMPVLDSAGVWYQPDGGYCQSLYDFIFPEIDKGECIELVIKDK